MTRAPRVHPTTWLWLVVTMAFATSASALDLRVPEEYDTIQEAIDVAGFGDQVLVSPGDYTVQLQLSSGVSLIADTDSGAAVRLIAEGIEPAIYGNSVTSLSIEGFELSGSSPEALVVLDASSPEIIGNTLSECPGLAISASNYSYTRIEGNLFLDNARAIELSKNSDAYVVDNVFQGQSDVALTVDDASYPEISGNFFIADAVSIHCLEGSAPWILDNQFEDAMEEAVLLEGASPIIRDNTFSGAGGAALVVSQGSQPIVQNNHFESNVNGLEISYGSPLIADNTFVLNSEVAIQMASRSYPTILHNIFQDNGLGLLLAGTSTEHDASPHVFNNTIITSTGTGIHCAAYAYPAIDNNIVAYNTEYGILCDNNTAPTLAYNDFFENGTDYGGRCSASSTDLSVDPLFVSFSNDGDPTNDDLHLQEGSPAADAGNPQPEYNDPDGSRNDLGAYGGPDDPVFVDMDGDGYTQEQGDCNDVDPTINPEAEEVLDGIDNNCDSYVDEWPPEATPTPEETPTPKGDDDTEVPEDSPEATPYPELTYYGEGCTCNTEAAPSSAASYQVLLPLLPLLLVVGLLQIFLRKHRANRGQASKQP